MCPGLVGPASVPKTEGSDGDISTNATETRARLAHTQEAAGETETTGQRVPDGAREPEETT